MSAHFPSRGKPLILHVEDSRPQLETLRCVLEGNGFAVLQANNAEEALQIFRDTPVSLVVADHMLSDSTGTELAGQLKAIKPAVPVVLHSGNPPASLKHLDGFISKGEPVRTLIAFIRDLINRFWE